jgi:hypothetical protein
MRVKPRRRYRDLGALLRILERRIPRRNPALLRQAVSKVLRGEDIHEVFHRSVARVLRPLAAIVIAALLAVGGWLFYQQGYWYELFKADRYGALVISALVDSAYKAPGELYFQPVLYREQNNQLKRLSQIDLSIRESPGGRTADSYILSTRRIYLEAGRYRLKVGLEDQLFWTSFTLSPRSVQKKSPETENGLQITLRQDNTPTLPLIVRYTVFNAETGDDITQTAKVFVLSRDKWLPLFLAEAEGLFPGRTYSFLVEREGYVSQEFDLILKPYQTTLLLEARLVPATRR